MNRQEHLTNKPRGQMEIFIEKKTEAILEKIDKLLCSEEVEKIACETGFVQRKSPITGHLFLSVFILGVVEYGNPSLEQFCGLLNNIMRNLETNRQSFDGRINDNTVVFLKEILGRAVKLKLPKGLKIENLGPFKRVMILDSTGFQLPKILKDSFPGFSGGASEAGMKIQFGYDLKSGDFFYVLQGATTPDNALENRFIEHVEPGDLWLKDLGYLVRCTFIDIDEKGGYYLSRLKSNVILYEQGKDGDLTRFDLETFLHGLDQNAGVTELDLFIKDGNRHSRTRLVIEPAPESVKNKRIRDLDKAARKKGYKTSERTKLLQGFTLFISNAPKEFLSADIFRLFYGLRWQVELMFKHWKSNIRLDEIPTVKRQRILCIIYARLIFIFITHHLGALVRSLTWLNDHKEISWFRAGKHFQTIAYAWFQALINNNSAIDILRTAMTFIRHKCLKKIQKNRLYPYDLLDIASLA